MLAGPSQKVPTPNNLGRKSCDPRCFFNVSLSVLVSSVQITLKYPLSAHCLNGGGYLPPPQVLIVGLKLYTPNTSRINEKKGNVMNKSSNREDILFQKFEIRNQK